jgi:hypothetical protein
MADLRGRLDAVFRAVTLKRPASEGGGRASWRQLPEGFGKADTVSRTYRRWAARGLWSRLLQAVADPAASPVLKGLTYFACCAFRRGIRALGGLEAVALARRLKLFSALPAPSAHVADPGLSEIYAPVIAATLRRIVDCPGWRPPSGTWRLFRTATWLINGRSRLRRAWEPA